MHLNFTLLQWKTRLFSVSTKHSSFMSEVKNNRAEYSDLETHWFPSCTCK